MGWILWDAVTLLIFGAAIGVLILSQREVIWREAVRRLKKNKLAIAATAILGLYSGLVFLDSISWPDAKSGESKTIVDRLFERPQERTFSAPLGTRTSGELQSHPVNAKHVLGTDSVGSDILFHVIKGMKTCFLIGGFSCLIAIPVGVFLGLLAGYFGGILDDLIQFVYTVFASIPDILLITAIAMMLGKSLFSIYLAMGFTSWVGLCRLVRGETMKHREREYVRAARALGASNSRIIAKHILPNLLPAIIITGTLLFSSLAIYETILSYIGVGVSSDVGSWGNMIDASRTELTRDPPVWWGITFSAGGLLILVLCLNIFADALRDAIDPRLRTS